MRKLYSLLVCCLFAWVFLVGAAAQEPLRIMGETPPLESADVQFTRSENDLTDLYTKHMAEQDSRYDVYELTIDEAFMRVKQEGFYVDLKSVEGIIPLAEGLHEPIAHILTDKGSLVGLPTSLSQTGIGYSRTAAQKLGLSDKDMPKTYDQWVEWVLTWQENPDGIRPYAEADAQVRMHLLRRITDAYADYYLADSDAARAIADEVAVLLDKVNAIGDVKQPPMQTGADQPAFLFTVSASVLPGEITLGGALKSLDFTYLPLMLTEGAQPIIPVQKMKAYVVNPYSPRIEEAKAYLSHFAQNMKSEAYVVTPDTGEYGETVKRMDWDALVNPRPAMGTLFKSLVDKRLNTQGYLKEMQDICDKVRK